jgi:hypothetical protein
VTNEMLAHLHLSAVVLAVSLSVTTAEFIEIQAMPVEALRTRFGLEPSCQPAVTALSTDPTASRMSVAIECRPDAATDPDATRPSKDPLRPSRPSGKGS